MDITWKRKWIFWLLLAVMLLFLPGKTFAAEKESKDADDLYTYHTAFDAKASLKIRHMKDYGVLDYEETVEVEDSCDYLDGNEDLDVIQAKNEYALKSSLSQLPMMRKFRKYAKECRSFPARIHGGLTGIRSTLNMKIPKKTDRWLPPDIFIRLTRSGQTGCWKKWRFRM